MWSPWERAYNITMSDLLPSDARVFTVASGKGGVGKTTTAVSVGAALAESGAETVVVDADLGMANVAELLDLSEDGPTLQDVLTGDHEIEAATYRTEEGLAVVPGSPTLESYGGADPAGLQAVVASLREAFEYVILDTGAGLSHDAALPLGLADAVVLVTTPRQTAASNTGKTRELAERIGATVGGVVVTRVREEPSELGPEAVSELVGTTVLTAVPEDGSVREALAAGEPIVTHEPVSPVTAAYRRLASALTGQEMVEPTPESTETEDGDDATSIEELLEREADHSTDVSALTGEAAVESDERDETDDPLAVALGGEDDQADPLADGLVSADDQGSMGDEDSTDDQDPTLAVGADADQQDPRDDGAELLGDFDSGDESTTDVDDEPDVEDDPDIGAGTDGDILIAEETPLDDDPLGGVADESPLGDPPAGGADFERGSQASDPLGSDPLADALDSDSSESDPTAADSTDEPDPVADAIEDDDIVVAEETSIEDDAPEGDDGTDEADEDEVDGDEGEEVDDGEETDDGDPAGPHVEMDDHEGEDESGLFGRFSGLFR